MDAAICFEVLEHLQEPQQALAEILRCLKPGGHALLSVPNAAFWTRRIEFFFTGFLVSRAAVRSPRARSRGAIRTSGFIIPGCCAKWWRMRVSRWRWRLGESFTLGALPVIWRKPKLRALADAMSRPVGWLGRVLPSWFAARIFVVAKKPDMKN